MSGPTNELIQSRKVIVADWFFKIGFSSKCLDQTVVPIETMTNKPCRT
jgi:hypothetical protein